MKFYMNFKLLYEYFEIILNKKKDNADISIGVKFEKETCTIVADFGCFVLQSFIIDRI